MSELLSQQVNTIYWLVREAITLDQSGNHYSALQTLRYIPEIIYDDQTEDANRLCVRTALKEIRDGEGEAITTSDRLHREIQIQDYRNIAAANCFDDCLDKLRDYMQKTGYFKLMNRDWILKKTKLTED